VTLTVRSSNRYPMFDSDPPTQAVVNQPYTYNVKAHDPDGDQVFFSLPQAEIDQGMRIDRNTGAFTWTPGAVSVYQIEIDVRDETGYGIAQVYSRDVLATAPDNPPAFTNAPGHTAVVGTAFTWDADATDPDAGDTVSFVLAVNPRPLSEISF